MFLNAVNSVPISVIVLPSWFITIGYHSLHNYIDDDIDDDSDANSDIDEDDESEGRSNLVDQCGHMSAFTVHQSANLYPDFCLCLESLSTVFKKNYPTTINANFYLDIRRKGGLQKKALFRPKCKKTTELFLNHVFVGVFQ